MREETPHCPSFPARITQGTKGCPPCSCRRGSTVLPRSSGEQVESLSMFGLASLNTKKLDKAKVFNHLYEVELNEIISI